MQNQALNTKVALKKNYKVFTLAFLSLVLLVASVYGVTAATINVDNTQDVAAINTVIASSNPGDTINFKAGTYQHELGEFYVFIGDRDYTFEDGTTIKGIDLSVGMIFQVIGSNIHIKGTGTVKLENTQKIGVFGDSAFSIPYTNITVEGLISQASNEHYRWLNIRNTEDRIAPDIKFSNMILIGGITGFHFQSLGRGIKDTKSPYISLDHITADGVQTILVDLFSIYDLNNNVVIIGDNDITNIALLNTQAIVSEGLWQYFHSPSNVAQDLNVTFPYINPAKNDFVTADMKLTTGYTPSQISPLVIRDASGKMKGYIGAVAPKLASVDVNGDKKINILDLIGIRNHLNTDVKVGDNWKSDVNNDMKINILDLIAVRNRLNTTP